MARIYKRPDTPYYYCDFVDAQGRRQQRSTHRKRARDAQLVADELERQSLRDPLELAREAATLRTALDLLSTYLHESVTSGAMAAGTAESYVAKAKQLKRVLGETRPLRTIDTAAVRDYCAQRRRPRVVSRPDGSQRVAKPAGSHTLVKEVTTLRIMLRLAKERGLWIGALDTLQPSELSAQYKPRQRVLTFEEVAALRAKVPHGRWRVVAFALGTGAELAAWDRAERADVDLAARFVRVRGTKRETRDREVPILLDICKELVGECLQGADYGGTMEAPLERPVLFRPWPNVRRDLAVWCAAAGIPPATPNDLRRSFATWHVEAGVPHDLLFRVLGHADTTMLARVYGRPRRELAAQLMREAIERASKK